MKRKTEYTDREIMLLLKMLQHDSIDFPIVAVDGLPRNRKDAIDTILFMRGLFEKGAIDHPEDAPMHIRLTPSVASLAGVVAARPSEGAPVRWMSLREAWEAREGRRRIRVRHPERWALESVPDHRRDYVSPVDDDSPLTIMGATEMWNSSMNRESCFCEVCECAPPEHHYCIRCDTIGGYENRKRK